jgi:hypothetical protein
MNRKCLIVSCLASISFAAFAQHANEEKKTPTEKAVEKTESKEAKAPQKCNVFNYLGMPVGKLFFVEPPGASYLEVSGNKTNLNAVDAQYSEETSTSIHPIGLTKRKDGVYDLSVSRAYVSYPPPGSTEKPTVKDEGRIFKGKLMGEGCEPLMADKTTLERALRMIFVVVGKI